MSAYLVSPSKAYPSKPSTQPSLPQPDRWIGWLFGVVWLILLVCFTYVIIKLPKTDFVFAYLLACAGVIGTLYFLRYVSEPVEDLPKISLSDPYLLAYLRGEANEALRVAAAVLIERQALVLIRDADSKNKQLVKSPDCDPKTIESPVERAVLNFFMTPKPPEEIFKAEGLKAQIDDLYREELVKRGLFPTEAQSTRNVLRVLFALCFVVVVGLTKITVALLTGHYNIGFTILILVVASFWAASFMGYTRTRLGNQVIESLASLHEGLRQNAATLKARGAVAQIALLAGVYGVSALPAEAFPDVRESFRAASSSSSSCGSSCSSSCGGDGGDGGSCGSGCGGCGGGCS